MKKFKTLIVIVFIASFFRLYAISSIPPSPSLDEVSIGYNAFSILKTAADEYGTNFPLLLRAYDDWRPALYVYLVIPFVWLFGLTTIAVRLPSVILSIGTIIALFFLTRELFKKNNHTLEFGTWKLGIPEISAFLLAISPWHIYISRLGHEVNAGLAFFMFALPFFFKKKIYISALFFVLSFMSYQSEKLFIPLIALSLAVLFWPIILEKRKQIILSIIIGVIVLIPFLSESLSPQGLSRFSGTSIFNSNSTSLESQKRAEDFLKAKQENNILGIILNSNTVFNSKLVIDGYVSHFNPAWLFWGNKQETHKVPFLGLLYPWELPFIVLGAVVIFISKIPGQIKIFLGLWILFSPLPAALTTDAPHAMRSITMLPLLSMLAGFGIIQFLQYIKKYTIVGVSVICIVVFVSIFYFSKHYFITFPKDQSQSFQYALHKSIPFVLQNQAAYEKIVFSNKDNLYQSYMFFLFDSAYDPALYQLQEGTKSGGYNESHTFSKYEFRPIDWNKDSKLKNTLFVGNVSDFPPNTKILKSAPYLNGEVGVVISYEK